MRPIIMKGFASAWMLVLLSATCSPANGGSMPGPDSLYAGAIPKAVNLKPLEGIKFYPIKAHEPQYDGFLWLHGVGLAWHKDRLYASFWA